jgi:hypothetical protein
MPQLLFLAAVVVSAPSPHVFALEAGASVWDVRSVDIDGDEQGEILALCCDDTGDALEKHVAVFQADGQGSFSPEPAFRLPLDPSVGAVFLAEVDGAAPVELVAVNAEGATVFAYRNGGLEAVDTIAFWSLFPSLSREPGFLDKATLDLDGDGIDEWLVPMPTGYAVRNVDKLRCLVECDVDSSMRTEGGTVITNRLPACHAFDSLGGDGRASDVEGIPARFGKGLAFLSDAYADFAYGENWGERARFAIPLELDDKWESSAQMHDFDNNGLPDLLVTQMQGTINLKGMTQVYMASPPAPSMAGSPAPPRYPKAPSAKFESKGSLAAPIVKDVNGDKKLDIVFFNVPWGLKFFVNIFVFKKLSVDLNIHLYHEDGFHQEPDFRANASIEAPEGNEQTAYALGDFSGDGYLDIAFGSGREKLEVHTGGATKFISSKPWATVALPAFGKARVRDIDGNGAEDIIIHHPGIRRKEFIEVVVF